MVVGLFILLIAFFLRIYNLTNLPIFVDEAIYVRWAQVMNAESTLRFIPLSDGKQPFYMWSVIPFLKIFSDPLFSARLLSVLTGVGAVIGVFASAYILLKSRKLALLSSFIYAILPFSIFFDRMALVDSMLAFFGIWIFFFGMLTAKTLRFDFALITGFVLGGALLTKSPAIFFTLLLPTTWLVGEWPKKRKKIMQQVIKLGLLLLTTYIIGYAMFNILRLGPNFHLLKSRNLDYVHSFGHIFENPLDPFVPHFYSVLDWFARLGTWPLVILAVAGFIIGIKKKLKELMLLSTWFLVPLAAQMVYAKILTARYILFVIPYLVIISSLSFLVSSKKLKYVLVAIFVLFVFFAMKQNYYQLTNVERMNLSKGERSWYLE